MATDTLGGILQKLKHAMVSEALAKVPDNQLLLQFLAHRDEAALNAIISRHGPMVYRICRRILSEEPDTEDAFQLTFLTLIRKAKTIRKRRSLASWLHGVAYHISLRMRTGSHRRREREIQASTQETLIPSDDLSWSEVRSILDEELTRLPEYLREPLVLCYLQGLTQNEATCQLGQAMRTFQRYLERGRVLLGARLTKRGITLSAALSATLVSQCIAAIPPGLTETTARFVLDQGRGRNFPFEHLANEVTSNMLVSSITRLAPTIILVAGLCVGGAWALSAPNSFPSEVTPLSSLSGDKSDGKSPLTAEEKPTGEMKTVRGKVLRPDGKPAAGANVFLNSNVKVATTAGADGGFTLSVPAETPRLLESEFKATSIRGVVVVAMADGFGPDWIIAPLDGSELSFRLQTDDVPINGRLLDLQGKPLKGVCVTVTRISAPLTGDVRPLAEWHIKKAISLTPNQRVPELNPVARIFESGSKSSPWSAITDTEGRFRLNGIGRDRLVVCVVSGPGVEQSSFIAITNTEASILEAANRMPRLPNDIHTATFDHVVTPGITIRGVIRDEVKTGQTRPVAGIIVRDGATGIETRTDTQGRYELVGTRKASDLPVHLIPPDGSTWFATSAVVARETGIGPVQADYQLSRGIPYQGKVTDPDGKPVPARVRYLPIYPNPHVSGLQGGERRDGFRTLSVKTAADGTFTVSVLPGPGAIVVETDKPGFRSVMHVDSQKYFKNEVQNYNDGLWIQLSGGLRTPVRQENYQGIMLVNVDEKAASNSCEITLHPEQKVAGQVLGLDGKPLTGVQVRGLTANGDSWQTLSGSSFEVRGLNPDRPRGIEFRHEEQKLVGYLVLKHGEREPSVTVRLKAWGTVTGQILTDEHKPSAECLLFTSGGQVSYSQPYGSLHLGEVKYGQVITDSKGHFRIEGLIPDLEYEFHGRPLWLTQSAQLAGGKVARKVIPKPGETADLGDVRFSRTGPGERPPQNWSPLPSADPNEK